MTVAYLKQHCKFTILRFKKIVIKKKKILIQQLLLKMSD